MMIATGTAGPVAVLYLPANSNFGMLFPRAEVFNRGSATPRGSAEILHGGHESFRKLEKKIIFPRNFFQIYILMKAQQERAFLWLLLQLRRRTAQRRQFLIRSLYLAPPPPTQNDI